MSRPEGELSILVVEDEDIVRAVLVRHLSRGGHRVRTATNGEEGIQLAQAERPDLVLTDINMPVMDGLTLLKRLRALGICSEAAVISANLDIPRAVSAFSYGACDLIEKPFSLARIDEAVATARGRIALQRSAPAAKPGAPRGPGGGGRGIVGRSAAMSAVRDLVARVGASASTVLIEGETGVGKEVVARGIHEASTRRAGPFVAVNCGALPEGLVEAELFGHEKGAYTGASAASPGYFRAASGGTLFLDEVGELPRTVQPKLLRALQEREVVPVGSASAQPVDVRIIAATNRDLDAEAKAGRFRQDLLFRLNVVRIDVPPLRSRLDDLEPLIDSFVARFNARYGRAVRSVEPAALERLRGYDFPGNVRELENLIERAFALGASDVVRAADLPRLAPVYGPRTDDPGDAGDAAPPGGASAAAALLPAGAALPTMDEAKDLLIERALEACGGNIEKAAEMLGISSKTISRRRKKE